MGGAHSTRRPILMKLIPTTLVGSYVQPDWLINREMLSKQMPPRVRVEDLWRVAPQWLEKAQDDATLLAARVIRIGLQQRLMDWTSISLGRS
jgi:hypothetical protein